MVSIDWKMQDITAIDWNEAWKTQSKDTKKKGGFRTCADRWADMRRCRKMSEQVKANNWKVAEDRIRDMDIGPGDRVLDIGAGPGTLAIPLARMVKEVTALEPSDAMLDCLRENMKEEGISNVRIIRQLWQDVDLKRDLEPPYDVVVASFSLGFPDLKEALEKMNEAASRYVYIFWFADGMSPWQRNYGEIWEPLFGIPDKGRKPNIVFNLLNQMGIYPNISIAKEEQVTLFPGIEEAVASQADGLNLSTPEQASVLREYLKNKLVLEDGQYVMRGTSRRATIWWEKDGMA